MADHRIEKPQTFPKIGATSFIHTLAQHLIYVSDDLSVLRATGMTVGRDDCLGEFVDEFIFSGRKEVAHRPSVLDLRGGRLCWSGFGNGDRQERSAEHRTRPFQPL